VSDTVGYRDLDNENNHHIKKFVQIADILVISSTVLTNSVAELHHFYAAPAPG
jgi:hypothetical protein